MRAFVLMLRNYGKEEGERERSQCAVGGVLEREGTLLECLAISVLLGVGQRSETIHVPSGSFHDQLAIRVFSETEQSNHEKDM